jgi:UDP-N-acetylglucosamine 2-epimerase (non-hydrolysing)
LSGYIVALVVGTRPEAIKLAPLAHALAAGGVCPRLILTGQHPALDAADHGLAGLPLLELHCRGREDPVAHAAAVERTLAPHLDDDAPDLLLVQGDTSSALGAARAAYSADIAIGHVEAGLRSHDRAMPWPEECNRVAIDGLADLLFAPTPGAAANLRDEGNSGLIYVTGNTGIDALLTTLAALPPAAARRARRAGTPLDIVVTCHRRENWGAGLATLAAALLELAAEGSAAVEIILHPNPAVAEVMHTLFAGQPGFHLAMPTTHRGMIARMRRADLILSDSGGVQEEAPVLGVPLLVLRDKTERPEAIACGNARLVGTSTERILIEVRALADDRSALAAMAQPSMPFGDGNAAPRIAALVREWLIKRDRPTIARRA